jgi:phosphatidylglycerophosphatase A
LNRLIIAVASAGYVGFSRWAPGTLGTAVGILVYLLYSPFPPLLYLLSTGALFFLACWISARAEVLLGQRDSPKIVIDEVIGYLITMAFLPITASSMAGGFLFFRVLDIIKPPPVNWINREMKGGWAVVLDDAVAGVYANVLLRLTAVFYPGIFSA